MRILLIQPKYNLKTTYCEMVSGALVLLGTMAKNEGHQVKVYHLDIDRVDLKQELLAFKPDILGITMNTFQTKSAKQVSKLAKEVSKDILVVAGGPHPSALKEKTFEDFPDIDAVVYGEGEVGFMELLNGNKQPHNTCFRGADGFKPIAYSDNLDSLPVPDYDLVDLRRFCGVWPCAAVPALYTMASRGCPYQCTFCNKSVWGKTIRYRRPEVVVDEVEYLVRKYGAQEVYFQDDTFNANLPWASEIFSLIIKRGLNRHTIYRMPCRANKKLITREFLELARRAGMWFVFYGVESGNEELLESMNKGITLDEFRRAFKLTREAGIKFNASFILGMPGETRKTVEETKEFVKETKPDYKGWAIATPFPGTELERQVRAKNHLLEENYDNYAYGYPVVRTDGLTRDELVMIWRQGL